MSNNPLLEHTTLPLFKQIEPKHIKPALEAILADNRKQLQQLLKQKKYSWNNFLAPLQEMEMRLQNMWAPIEQLNAVVNTQQLRKIYNQ